MTNTLPQLSRSVIDRLREQQQKIVFAESCTAGLLAASLGRIAGASQVLCGSAVTYRNETKAAWLNIDPEILADEAIGPVSVMVAHQMAVGMLHNTPEATLSVSVTGHLGPDAPTELDGLVYAGFACRDSPHSCRVICYQLPAVYHYVTELQTLRMCRQDDLVERIFKQLLT